MFLGLPLPWGIIILVVVFLLISGIVVMLMKTIPIADGVYKFILVKDSPDKWGRVCSAPDNEEQVAMWDAGCAWAEENKSYMKEVQIENEGLKLFGEYYDFGNDSLVMILPGRCESLAYSYFYAMPYKDMGVNVLVTDARCAGKSDGIYNTIGGGESRDLAAWIEFAESELGIHKIFLHTICLGAAAAILTSTKENAPESIQALIMDGAFTTFRETFKTHMIGLKKPVFPVLDMIMHNIKKNTGVNYKDVAPINHIGKLKKPVLFLYTELDTYSLPEKSRELFEVCGSSNKQIKWFSKGAHSHIRINNAEEYDSRIAEFVKEIKEA